jgi:hypothetical protein
MNRARRFGVPFALALLAVACGKSSHETTATMDGGPEGMKGASSPSASASTAASAPSSAPTEEAEDQPPTETRAERKAATEITHSTYKAELKKIEKELNAP